MCQFYDYVKCKEKYTYCNMCNPTKIKMEEEDDVEGWRCRRRKSENLMNPYKMKCEYIYVKSAR